MPVYRRLKIKKGDEVLITSGKDKGKKGKVIRVLPSHERVVVEGANMRKKHVRPKRTGQKGELVKMPGPIHISNVRIICPGCSRPARVGYLVQGGGKVRICKKCQHDLK